MEDVFATKFNELIEAMALASVALIAIAFNHF